MHKVATAAEHPIIDHACQVMDVTAVTADTFQIELQSPASTRLDYHAGQHLKLELDINGDGQVKPLLYSIANSFNSEQPRRLQLFIQNSSKLADKIVKRLTQLNENKEHVKVTLPMGSAFLQTDLGLRHIFIAAGSGISKIKCLTEEMLRQQVDVDATIYWSNKHANDFYLLDEFQNWVDQHRNLSFTPILESADTNWHGASGYIYEVIQDDFDDLSKTQVYLCGSPQMVHGTMDQLKINGLKEENCYSDVFEYSPRSKHNLPLDIKTSRFQSF